ncbi:PREDICTED: pentatricopeptide repeat-containing protein At1g80270, mitochondrial-like [Ipomoea nil]|uniref:pentatricopeptide repeat-containing protein At1g80270, mitochondrial-like n=1 Tax=Ipomoea nil TaxID=35883 RepID=UPI0009010FC1|nr:PREDICTED: pentatricopeptide repeat-containing protein At1g80270, mitochondrial-like [Ipomoea nil]
MWALRRASVSIRKQGLNTSTAQLCFATSELSNRCFEDYDSGVHRAATVVSDTSLSVSRFYKMACSPSTPFKGSHGFSSCAGTKSGGEDDDELDGFSELESPMTSGSIEEGNLNNGDELVSEPELFDDDAEGPQRELGSDTESPTSQMKANASSEILEVVLAASPLSVTSVLDKWVEEGKEVTQSDITTAMRGLRKRRLYVKALKLSEWLESLKHIDFTERDYASHTDLIAKVGGLQKAEAYVQKIPKSFRSEVVYGTLLANCAAVFNMNKAEEVFKKMKDLKFPISCFCFNQLLLVYKRTDKKKIGDVLLQMEKEGVKPDLFTYKMLIDAKGQYNDITGMEQFVELMKSEGIEPDLSTNSRLAKFYIRGGLNEKAEAVLKEMEADSVSEKYWVYTILLPLYAALGKADEVNRIWQLCGSNPREEQYMAAIEAWGKLKKVDKAEAIFETMLNKYPKMSSKRYSTLLNVYANNKMLAKGKDLVKRMTENGCHIGVSTWNKLVKLYIEAGEVEKADTVLAMATEHNGVRPMLRSYIAILEQYAQKGDIHNSEHMFRQMRQAGFASLPWLYQTLVRAYFNAKLPAYGMNERMKADKVFLKKELAAMLPKVDPFRKTTVSEIFE